MKKKIFLIIIIITVLFVIFLLTRGTNDSEFNLDTVYKYIIDSELKNPPNTFVAVTTYKNQYYEIDLERNTIEVREDYVLKGEDQYNRKLIKSGVLTNEEANQLDILFKKVIQEGKTVRTFDKPNKHLNYYLISNKEKTKIIMDDDNVIDKFLEIVKLELK